MNIEELYEQRWQRPKDSPHPDIFEHLPTLRSYAEKVRHITEIGTRSGNSTTGFLMGLSKCGGILHSYDREQHSFPAIQVPNVEWHFHLQNSHEHKCQPEPTEILFIDGDHSYTGVMLDLRFAPLVSKFIIMHDTAHSWTSAGGFGVYDAKADFLAWNKNWQVIEHFDNCCGLTIMGRT